MSASEILVIVFGLFLGYWVVANLLAKKDRQDPQPATGPAADSSTENPGSATPKGRAWHDVFGIAPDASIEEIRAAYRDLIGQYHPDKVAMLGEELQALAERKSKEINLAYSQAMAERDSPT